MIKLLKLIERQRESSQGTTSPIGAMTLILSIYTPNEDRTEFYKGLVDKLLDFTLVSPERLEWCGLPTK